MNEEKPEFTELVHNYIHAGKQFPEGTETAFLTVKKIGRFSEAGALDFGGGEYTEAGVEWLAPVKKKKEDSYGWWHLTAGTYHIEFNESLTLPEDRRLYLQIWGRAERNGASIPFRVLEKDHDPLITALTVGIPGIEIKENARLACLGFFD